MTGDQWLAVAALAMTIVGSIVGSLTWITRKHTELIVQISALRTAMVTIEKDWIDRTAQLKSELQSQAENGPAWLKPLMESQARLLEKSITESATAIEVAKQHGDEMNMLRRALENQSAQLKQLLELFRQSCRYPDPKEHD